MSDFPGPSTPAVIQAFQDAFDSPRFYAQRAKYGKTWAGRLPGHPRYLITSDREVIRRLFTGDPLTKHNGTEPLEPLLGGRSVMLLEPAEHLARRKLELPAFHGKRIQLYADRIRALFEAEVGTWADGTVIEVHRRAQALTLTVILELVLGVRDQALRDQLAGRFEALISPRVNNLSMFLPPWFARPWNPFTWPALWLLHRLDSLIHEQISRTRSDPDLDRREDVLATLVQARDGNGAGLSDAELRDELVTLLAAGHETTASAIGWAADLLSWHPEVQSQLRAGDPDYLKATAKEVLRIRTVAPIAAQRRVLEPFEIDGRAIGPETVIAVDADGLHHDPELYPEPDRFTPSRFIDSPPDGYSYLPFGGGAHRCLGAALAMLELEIAIDSIVGRCALAPAGPPARPVRRGPTWAPSTHGRVRISRRFATPAAPGAGEFALSP